MCLIVPCYAYKWLTHPEELINWHWYMWIIQQYYWGRNKDSHRKNLKKIVFFQLEAVKVWQFVILKEAQLPMPWKHGRNCKTDIASISRNRTPLFSCNQQFWNHKLAYSQIGFFVFRFIELYQHLHRNIQAVNNIVESFFYTLECLLRQRWINLDETTYLTATGSVWSASSCFPRYSQLCTMSFWTASRAWYRTLGSSAVNSLITACFPWCCSTIFFPRG